MATAQQPISPEVHRLVCKPVDAQVVDAQLISAAAHSLALQRAPEIVLEEAAKAAQALRNVIESKPNKVVISGRTYLTFEDWQTLGRFYGITVAARATTYLEYGRVRGFECHAEAILVSTGQVISAAQAMCLDDELKWSDKPLFQLRSMAQTRAQAKALRNVLAWVVVMAGYNPTPIEEMDGTHQGRALASRLAYTPMQPDQVRQMCFAIANASNLGELKQRYFAAGEQAKKANDRASLDAFIAAKDARKRELE